MITTAYASESTDSDYRCSGPVLTTPLRKSDRWLTVSSLAIATVIRTVLVCISYGCRVPAGIFVPSMAIGASFGRMLGILVQALHEARPDSRFFASCKPDVPCVTPGTYAFLGAAAALSGIMHITVSVVVIMFELTGALTFILPTMIVVGVTKAVSGRLGRGGIADRMIRFNGYPFLDNKEEHVFGVTVSKVMREEPAVIPCSGMELQAVQELLGDHEFQGYPVVDDRSTMMLLGYIDQTTLRYAIERATKERFVPLTATCFFTPPPSGQPTPTSAAPPITFDTLAPDSAPRMTVDFSRHVDPVPLAVHPHLALETVMEIFKKMGPRAILIEHRGQLAGLVTVKDCLRFQNKVEAETAGHQKDEHFSEEVQQRLWDGIVLVAEWVSERLSRCTRGRVRLSSPMLERARARSSSRSPERSRARGRRRGRRGEDPAAEGRGMLAAVEAGPGDSLELERR